MTTTSGITVAEYNAMKAPTISEKQLQDQIIRIAKAAGWLVYHTHDSRRSAPGFPDLVLVHPVQRRVLYRELKTQKGALSKDQKTWLNALHDAGADVAVWRPIDYLDDTINEQLAPEGV